MPAGQRQPGGQSACALQDGAEPPATHNRADERLRSQTGLLMKAKIFVAAIGMLLALIVLALLRTGARQTLESKSEPSRPQPLPSAVAADSPRGSEEPDRSQVAGASSSLKDESVGSSPGYDSTSLQQSSLLEDRMAKYLATFMTDQPDVEGWIGLVGDLAMLAELDVSSLAQDKKGQQIGQFAIPGTDMQLAFEVSERGYKLTLESHTATSEFPNADYMAVFGWHTDAGEVSGAYGSVQFTAPSEAAMRAFDQRIVGYVYEIKNEQMHLRPMTARMIDDEYRLKIPTEEFATKQAFTDLGAAFNWRFRFQGLDTPTAVRGRRQSTSSER